MLEGSPFLSSLTPPTGEGIVSVLQKKAWDRFVEIGLPTGREEAYRSLPLRNLYQTEIRENPLPAFLPLSLSSKALFISLEEAAIRFPFVVKDRLEKFIKSEINPFALLSFALHKGGAFLYLPPGTHLESPLELALNESAFTCPYLLIALGKNSSGSVSVRRLGKGLSLGVIDVFLDEGSRLHLTEVEEGGDEGISFHALRGEVKRDAHLEGLHFSKGGKIAFNHKRIHLVGEGAEADLSGLWTLRRAENAQMWVEMIHKEPMGRSRQHFKGALFDKSTSCFYGEIYVESKAQQTDAYQLNQNLLLGDDTRAEARPNLQIFADDVKASHGATVGGIHPEELFYLKTRGLSQGQARELLIQAFLDDILSLHPESARRKELALWISR